MSADRLDEIARELGALYLSIERRIARRAAEAGGGRLEKLSLSVLGRLDADGPMRPSALAHLVRLDLSTVSRHLAALEAEGLVRREPDPDDRRAWQVRVTRAGAEAVTIMRTRRREHMRRVLADWSADDRRELAALLARLNADMLRAEQGESLPAGAAIGGTTR